MSNTLQILKRKELWIPYLRKYAQRYANRAAYNIQKYFHVDPIAKDISYLEKYLKRNSGSLTYKYVIEHMQCTFICDDFKSIDNELKSDKDFMTKLKMTANNTLDRKFLVLGEEIDCVYDENKRHYRWHDDIIANYTYIMSHYSLARAKNRVPGVDIKNLWELSRMQYLFAPALLWKLEGDEKFAEFVKEVIDDWVDCNRLNEGPNWNIAMEAGIRVANMLLAFQLISNYAGLDDAFIKKLVASTYQHMNFILRNEENVAGRTSNHYLGGLLGLLAVSSTFIFLPNAGKVYRYAIQSFEKEIQKQILSDGGDFEGSTAYQRLVGEMFSLAAVIIKNSNAELSEMYLSRLESLTDYAAVISKPDGSFPQIGDNDGGRIFQLFKEQSNSSAFMVSMASAITGKRISTPLRKEVGCFVKLKDKSITELVETLRVFPESKHAIYRTRDIYCILTAGDAHRFGMSGHIHNDKLSFELMYKGINFVVDPGSGCYTSFPHIREALVSIEEHSTIQIGNSQQNANYSPFMQIKNPSVTNAISVKGDIDRAELSANITICDNEGQNVITRKIFIDKNNFSIIIKDSISGESKQKCICRYVLHPDVSVELAGNSAEITNNGISIKLKAPNEIRCSEGLYSDTYGKWGKTSIIWCEYCDQNHDISEFYTHIELCN